MAIKIIAPAFAVFKKLFTLVFDCGDGFRVGLCTVARTMMVISWAEEVSDRLRPRWWQWKRMGYWRRQEQPADVLAALKSDLMGEHDPLKAFGIVVSKDDR